MSQLPLQQSSSSTWGAAHRQHQRFAKHEQSSSTVHLRGTHNAEEQRNTNHQASLSLRRVQTSARAHLSQTKFNDLYNLMPDLQSSDLQKSDSALNALKSKYLSPPFDDTAFISLNGIDLLSKFLQKTRNPQTIFNALCISSNLGFLFIDSSYFHFISIKHLSVMKQML